MVGYTDVLGCLDCVVDWRDPQLRSARAASNFSSRSDRRYFSSTGPWSRERQGSGAIFEHGGDVLGFAQVGLVGDAKTIVAAGGLDDVAVQLFFLRLPMRVAMSGQYIKQGMAHEEGDHHINGASVFDSLLGGKAWLERVWYCRAEPCD
jgi:hypothetical protein